jgi:phenylalanyl-tRNA synthetase beta chain
VLISRAWLTELLAGSDIDLAALDDREIAAKLTDLGLEVEGVQRVGEGLDAVRVGQVAAVKAHPDADKLRIVDLQDGTGIRTIVCGAPNVPAPGGKVVFVPPGSRLPGGVEIGARAVRGVASAGMICSEEELGIGPDGSGILVLSDDDARAGDRLVDRVAGVVDTIIELGVTPNRPDALGHVGVARDLAVKLGGRFVPPRFTVPDAADAPTLVENAAPDRCGRYFGIAFAGASIGDSPLWLRVRLHRLGLRPLSNVVDVTNLVMLEWGQPLHAFDRARLAEGRVVVRRARAGETMRMLDGRELPLSTEDLVIADARVPQALAGVMGGEHSGVEANTTDLLLEAAWFHPMFVRRTAKAHGLSTDSSHRFERGVDHGFGLESACARACSLFAQLAGARVVGKRVVQGERPVPPAIPFRRARSRMLLGIDVPEPETRRIFDGLGIAIEQAPADAPWICRPPTHRPDLELEVDLVDELVRHHGLDRLPMTPSPRSLEGGEPDRELAARRHEEAALVDAMREHGLHETISFVFTRPEVIESVGEVALAEAVALANPMRVEASFLRTHMLPGLLDALAINLARHAREVALFERGRVYAFVPHDVPAGPTAAADRRLPFEPTRLAVLRSPGARPDRDAIARADPREVGATLVESLARVGHAARVVAARTPVAWLHPGAQAELAIDDAIVGRFGRVHPSVADRWDLPAAAAPVYGELWLEHVPTPRVPTYAPLPRFPSTARDLSLDLAASVPAATVVAAIVDAHRELAVRGGPELAVRGGPELPASGDDPPRLATGDRATAPVELIEDHRGEGVADGRRALLLRMHYRAAQRSVTDAEVQGLHLAIVERAVVTLRALDSLVSLR